MADSSDPDKLSPALRHAQAALAQLRAENPELADSLKSILPGYALRLEKSNQPVTAESLLINGRKGVEWLKTQKATKAENTPEKTPLEIYQEIVDGFPRSPAAQFLQACAKGDLEKVKSLHETYVGFELGELVPAEDNDDLSPLLSAIKYRHLPVVQFLYEKYVNSIYRHTRQILTNAAATGDLDILDFAYQRSPQSAREHGWLIHAGATHHHLPVLVYAHQNGADFSKHTHTIKKVFPDCHADVMDYLVQNGADTKLLNEDALIKAAREGRLDAVKYLHKRGLDITADGDRALREAAANGHLEIVKYLHQNGADITARYNEAVMMSASNNHLAVVKYLHQNGADITAYNNRALINAARHDHFELVKYLHQNGCDITAQDHAALRGACSNDCLHIANYLRDHGGEPPSFSFKDILLNYKRPYEHWRQVLRRDPPEALVFQDPRHFKEATYEFVKPLLDQENARHRYNQFVAFHAAGLFQSPQRVMQYLKQWGQVGTTPLADLLTDITLPDKDCDANLKDWGDAILKCGPAMANLLRFADKVPSPARSRDSKTWSYAATRLLCAPFAYTKGSENPELAALCFENDIGGSTFNNALAIASDYAPEKNLPDITIKGERFDMPGATFRRLPPGDVKGLVLGKLTDCCQSIDDHGHDCAVYGHQSANGGFYVVEKADGTVASQTFAWRTKDGGLCFDTLETLGGNVSARQWDLILKDVGDELTRPRQDHDLTQLTVGMGGRTPRGLTSDFGIATKPGKPLDYTGYTEAGEQITVWDQQAPRKPMIYSIV